MIITLPLIEVRANWGRWVALCLRCPSALTVDRFASGFRCMECGSKADLVWPSEEMTYGIERLLLMRPNVITQNWEPGETLVDLMVENAAHGIFAEVPGELSVDNERIQMDTLPSTRRPELRAVS